MAKVEELSWGRSIDILSDLSEREIGEAYSGGLNELNPKSYIQLHPHLKDREVYIPQTTGIKILVLSFDEYVEFGENEIQRCLDAESVREIGEVVECPKGFAHMAINISDSPAAFVFLKFKDDTEK